MNILSPPTDSLYKFLAIAGLIGMITGIFMMYSDSTAEKLALKYEGQAWLLQKETKLLTAKIELDTGIEIKDSVPARLLFSLPKDQQKAFTRLLIKREQLLQQKRLVDHYRSKWFEYSDYYLILIVIGELVAGGGFIAWWYYIQRPLNRLEAKKANEQLETDTWQTHCQSCLRTMRLTNDRGSESDGKPGKTYCRHCYTQGSFTEPELTRNEAEMRLIEECKKRDYSTKQLAKKKKALQESIRWAAERYW